MTGWQANNAYLQEKLIIKNIVAENSSAEQEVKSCQNSNRSE